MATVTSVTSHFPVAKEGFTTTLSSTIASAAATVPLNSVTGYSNGDTAVLVIEPASATNKQVVTGIVDTTGVQLTSAVWTEGTNQTHNTGSTVVDYVTATHMSMVTKGILVDHSQSGGHEIAINYDPANTTLETQKWAGVASAVNEITVTNSATGAGPIVSATGGDTDIDVNITPKGTGRVSLAGAGAPVEATVATQQTTTSTTYADLATTTDTVTAVIGSSGKALLNLFATITNNTNFAFAYVTFVASGANTIAASDTYAIQFQAFAGNASNAYGASHLLTGLTAGSTVFKLKYRVQTGGSGSGTGAFSNRKISAIPL